MSTLVESPSGGHALALDEAVQVRLAVTEVVDHLRGASRQITLSTAGTRREVRVGMVLRARLERVETAGQLLVAATQDGDRAQLRRASVTFSAMTAAFSRVQASVG